jgi:hypothetical protein
VVSPAQAPADRPAADSAGRYDLLRLDVRDFAELTRLLLRSDLDPAERRRRRLLLAQAECRA